MSKDVNGLIAGFQSSHSPSEIVERVSEFSARHDFPVLMLGHMTNPMSHARHVRFLISTCPSEMFDRLQKSDAFLYDPVLHRMLRASAPYRWSAVHHTDPPPKHTMLSIVRTFGFEDGMSFPIFGLNGTPGGISLCGAGRGLVPEEIDNMHRVYTAAFHRLEALLGPFVYEQNYGLTSLERAALQCAAGGKSTSETADILGIAADSAKDALKRARRKLGARNTAQAVAIAVAAKLMV